MAGGASDWSTAGGGGRGLAGALAGNSSGSHGTSIPEAYSPANPPGGQAVKIRVTMPVAGADRQAPHHENRGLVDLSFLNTIYLF